MANVVLKSDVQIRFETLFQAVHAIYAKTPALQAFVEMPDVVTFRNCTANPVAAIPHLLAMNVPDHPLNAAFFNAVCAVAKDVEWRLSYAEDQVGADFLNRYGWFELYGPKGHFRCDTARGYVAFWGAGLDYPDHWHEAEELYFIAAGGGRFEKSGAAPLQLKAGDTQTHASNQPHAMLSGPQGVLAFILWRGQGLDGAPFMPETIYEN